MAQQQQQQPQPRRSDARVGPDPRDSTPADSGGAPFCAHSPFFLFNDNAPPPSPPSGECVASKQEMFQACFRNLKEFFLRQNDLPALEQQVRRDEGDMIRLRNPHTWYLVVRSAEKIPPVRCRDFSRYLCCESRLVTLGVLAVRKAAGLLEEMPCAMLLSERSNVYVYDWLTDGMFLVAEGLRTLADRGLLDLEAVYRHAATPLATKEPSYLVAPMLSLCDDVGGLMEFARRMNGDDVWLRTPGRLSYSLKLLGSVENLRKLSPYAFMTEEQLQGYLEYVTVTIRCPWHVLGAVGLYTARGVFVTNNLVLSDVFGRIYATNGTDGEIYRAADNIKMFFKIGLRKRDNKRFDRNYRGQERLEQKTICSHGRWDDDRDLQYMIERGLRLTPSSMEGAYKHTLRHALDPHSGVHWECLDEISEEDLLCQRKQRIAKQHGSLEAPARIMDGLWIEKDVDDPRAKTFRCPTAKGPRWYMPLQYRWDSPDEDKFLALRQESFVEVYEGPERKFAEETVPDLEKDGAWSEIEVMLDRLDAALLVYESGSERMIPTVVNWKPCHWFFRHREELRPRLTNKILSDETSEHGDGLLDLSRRNRGPGDRRETQTV